MSYSRWSETSIWYTFWSSSCSPNLKFKLPTKKLKNGQCFEICDDPSLYITYGDLKERGIKTVVKEVQQYYKDKMRTSFSDYTNLRWYLVLFMDDVENHFMCRNFFIFEWYYPIKNKIRWWFRRHNFFRNDTKRKSQRTSK